LLSNAQPLSIVAKNKEVINLMQLTLVYKLSYRFLSLQ